MPRVARPRSSTPVTTVLSLFSSQDEENGNTTGKGECVFACVTLRMSLCGRDFFCVCPRVGGAESTLWV